MHFLIYIIVLGHHHCHRKEICVCVCVLFVVLNKKLILIIFERIGMGSAPGFELITERSGVDRELFLMVIN